MLTEGLLGRESSRRSRFSKTGSSRSGSSKRPSEEVDLSSREDERRSGSVAAASEDPATLVEADEDSAVSLDDNPKNGPPSLHGDHVEDCPNPMLQLLLTSGGVSARTSSGAVPAQLQRELDLYVPAAFFCMESVLAIDAERISVILDPDNQALELLRAKHLVPLVGVEEKPTSENAGEGGRGGEAPSFATEFETQLVTVDAGTNTTSHTDSVLAATASSKPVLVRNCVDFGFLPGLLDKLYMGEKNWAPKDSTSSCSIMSPRTPIYLVSPLSHDELFRNGVLVLQLASCSNLQILNLALCRPGLETRLFHAVSCARDLPLFQQFQHLRHELHNDATQFEMLVCGAMTSIAATTKKNILEDDELMRSLEDSADLMIELKAAIGDNDNTRREVEVLGGEKNFRPPLAIEGFAAESSISSISTHLSM